MHRLATILHVTDDRRNSVPIARPLVRSAKKPWGKYQNSKRNLPVLTFGQIFQVNTKKIRTYSNSWSFKFTEAHMRLLISHSAFASLCRPNRGGRSMPMQLVHIYYYITVHYDVGLLLYDAVWPRDSHVTRWLRQRRRIDNGLSQMKSTVRSRVQEIRRLISNTQRQITPQKNWRRLQPETCAELQSFYLLTY